MLTNEHDLMNAEHERRRMAVQNYIDGLSSDNLAKLILLVQGILTAPSSEISAALMNTQLATIMRVKYNLCACGEDHDGDILARVRHEMNAGFPASDDVWEPRILQHALGGGPSISLEAKSGSHEVRCPNCRTVWPTVTARLDAGPACPECGHQ